MIQLYGAPGSVFVRKVRICLQEKGIEFENLPVSPLSKMPDDYRTISPLGKIPAIKDGSFSLADSSVICAYLEKTYPKPTLYPQEPEKYAKALWFEEYADTKLFQALAPFYYQTVLTPIYKGKYPNQDKINIALTETLPQVADYLSAELRGYYLVGNQLTIADIAVVSVFFNMVQSGYAIDAQKWPVLSSYLNFHFQQPRFKQCEKDIQTEIVKIPSHLRSEALEKSSLALMGAFDEAICNLG